jgi:GTP-binding protein EngB required for normal cell division
VTVAVPGQADELSAGHPGHPAAGHPGEPAAGHPGEPAAGQAEEPAPGDLSRRLTAVARLIQIGAARPGPGGFDGALLAQAEELLARAGQRLRLSSEHTIVVLAGGTGSGKSALFNRLAGAEFSPVGVVRPVTREPHACVWGMTGAGPLLDWLGVPARHRYARSSALDEGERSLAGLLLLDLPDHDSVLAGATEVNRLVSLADLMVWVLDPQKYADAAVHSRYLVPMAGHSAVITVVLNQADLLTPEQAADCEADLRRLLDTEGLPDARVVIASAVTGQGIADLRQALLEAVLARQAAVQRIAADVDVIAARFAAYGDGCATGTGPAAGTEPQFLPQPDPPGSAPAVPPAAAEALARSFAQAAGVAGVGRALQSARELRAVDYLGWPVGWLAERLLRRDPARRIRLGALWDELRGVCAAGPAGAQQAQIDTAITALAEEAGRGLPAPWPGSVRAAARSRAREIPAALGAATAAALPAENRVLAWWRLVAAWQGVLLGAAAFGVAWLVALLAVGVFHTASHAPVVLRDTALLPWVALVVTALLALGWLSGNGAMALASRAAGRERELVQERIRAGVAEVARQMVVAPVEQELSEYQRFREALAAARGTA